MAKISGGSDEKVFRIQSFLGLNESPDGDTKLKLGEAAAMRNFKITRDGSLQKRPGLMSVGNVSYTYSAEEGLASGSFAYTSDNYITVSKLSINSNTGSLYATSSYKLYAEEVESKSVMEAAYFISGTQRWVHPSTVVLQSDGKYKWGFRSINVVSTPKESPVKTLWSGYIGGKYRVMCVSNGCLIEVNNGDSFVFRNLGQIGYTGENLSMFGYNDKLYFSFENVSGDKKYIAYAQWSGVENEYEEPIEPVYGYVPIVVISITSTEGAKPFGSTLERVNLLSKERRVWLSPESTTSVSFNLPEKCSVSYVKSLVTGDVITDYTVENVTVNDRTITCVTFSTETTLIEKHIGENTIEVCYSIGGEAFGLSELFPENGRIYVEQYNGTQDTRIFMCSDRSNKIYYSGLDYNGQPRADYFPDLNVISIGDSSDNVTGMIRHYSRLVVYKKNSTYSIQYGTISLADGTTTAAFYCTPINKRIGNEAFGQVQLVLNSPRTLHGKDLYEWKNNSSYSSNLTIDERQARRISDRIYKTLATFDFSKCYCYDDNDHQEYYICYDKKALVHNYAVDAWYYYDNFDVTCMVNFQGNLYAGDSQGRFNLVSRANRTDNGEEITGYWESGAEPFDREFMRKYSSMLWLTLKPELRSKVQVTVETDRKSDHAKKTAASSLFTFSDADFRQWSFNTNRKPHITRLKIKAKKFAYYKLILSFSGENTTATVVAADMRIRYTGYAK